MSEPIRGRKAKKKKKVCVCGFASRLSRLDRRTLTLPPVQGGHEEHLVAALELIGLFALELPVGVVDQDQDTRATVFVSVRTSCPGRHDVSV